MLAWQPEQLQEEQTEFFFSRPFCESSYCVSGVTGFEMAQEQTVGERATLTEESPFTADQLAWIDQMIVRRQASVASRSVGTSPSQDRPSGSTHTSDVLPPIPSTSAGTGKNFFSWLATGDRTGSSERPFN